MITRPKPDKKLILSVPKGRILEELFPLLKRCGIEPEDDFFDKNSRKLQFKTNHEDIDIIRVRAFDVATFVAYGAADFGIVGNDALEEFDYSELYAPLDLDIGTCRLSVAAKQEDIADLKAERESHIRIATKYPNITKRYYASLGIQADCIKLNGAMEIAPSLGMCRRIVDLVSTGSTLKANGLEEIETILDVSSRLIVNRSCMKLHTDVMQGWIETFTQALSEHKDAAE